MPQPTTAAPARNPGSVAEQPRTCADLLDTYTADDLFFRSARRCLLARGRHTELPADTARAALGRVATAAARAAADRGGVGTVVGAIPFSAAEPAELFVPERLWTVDPALDAPVTAPAVDQHWQVRPVPAVADYESAVAEGLALIGAETLDKIVLARALDVRGDTPIDVPTLLRALLRGDATGYAYAVPTRAGTAFVGCSPELLVSRAGTTVTATPLAGSSPRSSDPVEDRRRREALLVSAKDLHEHAIVADDVAAVLSPLCTTTLVTPTPVVVGTASMWHLASRITGTLADPATTALDLAVALHPTPAVCGLPPAPAATAIERLEPFGRGLFAGAAGWVDADGDGEWTVAIRCAETAGTGMRLYAGAGVVAGSTPAAEAAETGAKFQTMLTALGIEHSL
ncbi:isochorismate synthase [Rhodococcus sp. X156]|uniref:isochorismate synthase n=1 Tax=Rhodococcus sp. X156 TaxID=2499145 RepID=UPI0013E3B417|nr:isochorismate synthase [Rhodococcus sp. X156]